MAKDTTTKATSIDDEPAQDDVVQAQEVAVTDHGDNFCGEYVQLTINSGEGTAGRQAVFVGINGYGLNIPRDTPVKVPVEVVQQLDNCMMTIYESVEGGGVKPREVNRFSTTVRPLSLAKK